LQAECDLLLPERGHETRPVLPAVPREQGFGMNPVDHDVDVLVGFVPVGDDEGLMSGQPQVPQGGIYDTFPLFAAEVLARGERDREVLHRLVGLSLSGGGSHHRRRVAGLVERQLASGGPEDALGVRFFLLAGEQVAGGLARI
jgi:hypothetical protein